MTSNRLGSKIILCGQVGQVALLPLPQSSTVLSDRDVPDGTKGPSLIANSDFNSFMLMPPERGISHSH